MKCRCFCLTFLFVSVLTAGFAQYDGIVGSEGCQAVRFDDKRIVAWAVDCQVQRGYYDIAKNRKRTSYGNDTDAIGPATLSTTTHVVSLGDSGVATVTFAVPITDGPGYDFAVFENGLNDTFLELAFVEVSSDGERFVRFPAVSNTPADVQVSGSGKVDATKLHNLAGKYRVGYGTPFDLEELKDSAGLDIYRITHVRMVDVIGTIDSAYASYDANGNIINDPYPTPFYSSGFDLSGVAVLDQSLGVRSSDASPIRTYPNPADGQVCVELRQEGRAAVSFRDAVGRLLLSCTNVQNAVIIDTKSLPAGLYFLTCVTPQGCYTEKLIIRH